MKHVRKTSVLLLMSLLACSCQTTPARWFERSGTVTVRVAGAPARVLNTSERRDLLHLLASASLSERKLHDNQVVGGSSFAPPIMIEFLDDSGTPFGCGILSSFSLTLTSDKTLRKVMQATDKQIIAECYRLLGIGVSPRI